VRNVLTTNILQSPAGRSNFAGQLTLQPRLVDDLPEIPVMPKTLLLMELGTHEFAVDLGAISQLVLSDLGATLQILRLAARECGDDNTRPERIEDYISAFGPRTCLKAAAGKRVVSDFRSQAVFETWAHAREIALAFKALAEESQGSIRPDEAYLTGLCHVIGFLPEVLGWKHRGFFGDDWTRVGLKLAERWCLPSCIAEFFIEMQLPQGGTRWGDLAHKAHQMATRSPSGCPLFKGVSPHLCRQD
jgi:hypothetical protein